MMLSAGLLCAASATALAQDFTDAQQEKAGNAYGEIQGYIATMDHMKGQCGAGVGDLTGIWKGRNAVPLAQTDALWKRYLNWAAKKTGATVEQVEAALRDQLKPLQDGVVKSFAKFDASPADAKAVVCRNFATAVNAGDWDVKTKDPALAAYLAGQGQ